MLTSAIITLMLIDEASIRIKGGHGGAGKVSFRPGKKSGPDGGNGGKGGDVYVVGTSDLTSLNQFSKDKFLSAENGSQGGSNNKSGRDGNDLLITLPLGTEIIDKQNDEKISITEKGQKILVCKGGIGGKGNFELKSSRRTTPEFAQKGLEGEDKNLDLVIKILADFGLIGLPNAGKSSLLNELTKAEAKIGDYPFTTLEPNLGVLNGKIIADIPGLIEGASEGRGLGIKFLKHIEKVSILLHCISAESKNLEQDYKVVMNELRNFSEELISKKQIILLTKIDLVDKKHLEEKVNSLKKIKHAVIPVSIYEWDSLQNLIKQFSYLK